MKLEGIIVLITGAALVTACTKAPPPPPEPIATPKPAATPHPAGAGGETAVRMYPDLAKPDSTFNKAFREMYEQRLKTKPSSLAVMDWPLDIAHRVGTMLQVMPKDLNAPVATPRPATPVPATPAPTPAPRVPNALERGAYDQKKEVARPPVLRY